MLVGVALAPSVHAASSYSYETFAAPGDPTQPGNPFNTNAWGINNSGQVSGWITNAPNYNGFIYSNGEFTTIKVPGHENDSGVRGINDSGQVVGDFGINHHFVYSEGVFTTFDVPGATYSDASGINNSGQIVGSYSSDSSTPTSPLPPIYHGFIRSGGVFTTLDMPVPDAISTFATGINDNGQVVGYYTLPGYNSGGFVYSNGVYTTLAHDAQGINNSGQILGGSGVFSLSDSTVTPIDAPVPGGWIWGIYGISNNGQIVGTYQDSSFAPSIHAFIATPIAAPVPIPRRRLAVRQRVGGFGGFRTPQG